jgi:hypothetical protein
LDNPQSYALWYLALEPAGAVAEAFGDLSEWVPEMFEFPGLDGARRCLATYRLDDELPLLELNDSRNLLVRGLNPTQVIERNRSATQIWALSIFEERNDQGDRSWQGVRWWSYHRPQWCIIGYWGKADPELLKVEELSLDHPAVVDAALSLRRKRRSSISVAEAGSPEDSALKILIDEGVVPAARD